MSIIALKIVLTSALIFAVTYWLWRDLQGDQLRPPQGLRGFEKVLSDVYAVVNQLSVGAFMVSGVWLIWSVQ